MEFWFHLAFLQPVDSQISINPHLSQFTYVLYCSRISRLCLCDCLFESKESERQVERNDCLQTTAKPRRLT